MSTADKLDYLLETKNQIKEAIQKKGVSIADTDSFRSYANKITQIESSSGSIEDWQPQLDWFDIEGILANDTEDYKQKIICLLTDELDDKSTSNIISGAEKYKLSDGQVIEHSANTDLDITNLFDTTKDKACSKGYKTRYIIYYSNSESELSITLPNNVIYTIFSGVIYDTTPFSNKEFLQCVKFVNNTRFTSTNMSSHYSNCRSLKQIPDNLDTSNITNMSYFASGCFSLEKLPRLNTSKVLNMTSMCASCYELKIMADIDTSAATNMNNMFNNCYALRQTSNLNTTNVKSMLNILNNCYLLYDVNINRIASSLTLSTLKYLNHESLLRILNALVDLTNQTSQILTLRKYKFSKIE